MTPSQAYATLDAAGRRVHAASPPHPLVGRDAMLGELARALDHRRKRSVLLVGDDYVEAPGVPVTVVDTVGAGDAFAAAFVHGLMSKWPVAAPICCAIRC